jgi:hypothetical protein
LDDEWVILELTKTQVASTADIPPKLLGCVAVIKHPVLCVITTYRTVPRARRQVLLL